LRPFLLENILLRLPSRLPTITITTIITIITIATIATQAHTSKEQCKHGGYLKFSPPAGPFKNQGQCVSYVEHH
jgi:hypothetical protein